MTNNNDLLRAALFNDNAPIPGELKQHLEAEIDQLLSGAGTCSVPYERGIDCVRRIGFRETALAALRDCDESPSVLLALFHKHYIEGDAQHAFAVRTLEPVLRKAARRMILRAWLGDYDQWQATTLQP